MEWNRALFLSIVIMKSVEPLKDRHIKKEKFEFKTKEGHKVGRCYYML
jgi:hypothetical protein